ncbi:hypothetical protein P7C71_g4577, partial [Lecanoromycetidae sp. Uapishka_2]
MALFYASLLFEIAVAMPGLMPLNGPMPTPMGLMATAGISPRPTEAPGFNGIPQELRRRQDVQYPPPLNWCGFVDGFYDTPLSCSVGLTCVNSLEAMGCCTATTGICTALYTTCLNYGDTCGQACQLDPAIRKCADPATPYCGTYAFPGETSLFDCQVTSAPIYPVEFLNDYYITAIGSTLASNSASASLGAAVTSASSDIPSASATTNSFSGSTYNSDNTGNNNEGSSGGLSPAAIHGIAVGVAIGGLAIIAIIVFFCARARKRRRIARASRPNIPPPAMQQQGPPPAYQAPPKAFDGYQSVPQQDQQQQYPQYAPFEPTQTAYQPPPGAPSTLSPQPTGASEPRFSTANASIMTPQSPEIDGRQSYYKAPTSPDVREVDGTLGNPGVSSPEAHGAAIEVDGTMGNPG